MAIPLQIQFSVYLHWISHDKIMDPVKIMLEQAGINFEELNNKGIDQDEFCDYITGSGILIIHIKQV